MSQSDWQDKPVDYEPPEEHNPQDDMCVCGHPRWHHTNAEQAYFCHHIDYDNSAHEIVACDCQQFKLAEYVVWDDGVPYLSSEHAKRHPKSTDGA
jgi:hypothetical protein